MRLFKRNNADSATDRNISLVADGWTLIGHSSDSAFSIDNTKFIASDGTEYTWANAIANNKVYAYLAYWDSTPLTAADRKYKYSSLSTLSMDDSNLQPKTGYWVWAKEAGKLNLPSVGGTLNGTTYAWSDLRFKHSNGTELNSSQVIDGGWIQNPYYWIPSRGGRWRRIPTNSPVFNSWQGYLIWSDYNNITLIRQN